MLLKTCLLMNFNLLNCLPWLLAATVTNKYLVNPCRLRGDLEWLAVIMHLRGNLV
jgi:hypothetical protein